MDFGALGMEGLVGSKNGVPSQVLGSRSVFVKQERSAAGEEDRGASKMAKTGDLLSATTMGKTTMPLLRSNSQQEQMLSFSSHKSESPLLRSSHASTVFPYYHNIPSRSNAGYGSGSLNGGMHGAFSGVRGPFTPSQWVELEHQALIYKYITANVPIPSNLLIPLKKSLYPYGLSFASTGGSYPLTNLYGWGTFHLGYSGSTDPEPGRCRRTDGKKWRCSRDAVADQKYCERHINRGRHRSRKPVEGQTGQAASGTAKSKVLPMTSSMPSTPVITSGGASNSLAIAQPQFKNILTSSASSSAADVLVNRVQDTRSLVSVKSSDSAFSIPKQDNPFDQESSQSLFGIVSSDSLLNPSQRSSYLNCKNYGGSFLDFNDQETRDHPLRQFMDDWPKDDSDRSVITWPEELKSEWTQLSMSIPMASSEFSSSSSSPTHEKLALSPLRLSREFDPIQTGLLGVNNELTEPNQKQSNWIPISWGSSMGGPLGEALTNKPNNVNVVTGKNSSSSLNLGWDGGSPQLGSSPTGVLQKSTFCSLSNSSSGCSSIADNNRKNTHDGSSLGDDLLGSTLVSSSSIPSL